MKIDICKITTDAIIPTKKREEDAGYDLYSNEQVYLPPNHRTSIKTGISISIPYGYVGLIWPRSGLSVKHGIDVLAGVVDSGYIGEIAVCLYNTGDQILINKGDRIAQILFQRVENIQFEETDSLSQTNRGSGGFGSSGLT